MGEEARSYVRHKIDLAAMTTFAGQYSTLCTIRDFCIGGLFLDCKEFVGNQLPAEVGMGSALIVEFDTPEGGLFLEGEIVRLSEESGIGVKVTERNLEAILFLQAEASSHANRQQQESRRELIRRECAGVISAFLSWFFESALQKIEDYLFELYNQAEGKEREPFHEAFLLLQQKSWQVRNALMRRVEQQLLTLSESDTAAGYQLALATLDKRDVVDNVSFSNWISITNLVNEIEHRKGADIVIMEARLSEIAVVPVTRESHPAGPLAIINIFGNVLQEFFPNPEVSNSIFKTFAALFQRRYGELLNELGLCLDKHGISKHCATDDEPAPLAGEKTDPKLELPLALEPIQQRGIDSHLHKINGSYTWPQLPEGDEGIEEEMGLPHQLAQQLKRAIQQARTARLKQLLAQKLEKILCGQAMPAIVFEFLNLGWKNLLLAILKREGVSSTNFVTYLKVLEQLSLFLSYQKPFNEDQQQRANRLLHWLERVFPVAATDSAAAEQLLERLRRLLQREPAARYQQLWHRIEAMPKVRPESSLKRLAPEEGSDTELWQSLVKRCQLLHKGEGMIAKVSGHPICFNLLWKDGYTEQLLFIDGDRSQLLQLSMGELALGIYTRKYYWI
ncbi:DUF1631 family protein [Ectothiorhodospiraceae bacterium BW-2]|nr:DUF1631 family protein [Ectothiorhodospiraceae bacterium BW-2]